MVSVASLMVPPWSVSPPVTAMWSSSAVATSSVPVRVTPARLPP